MYKARISDNHNSIDNHSYSLHVLLTGLFHRGISQSGTALCFWALAANGSSSHQAKKLASLLDCPTSPTVELVDCLRTKDARDIIATDKQFMVYDVLVTICFMHCYELIVIRSFGFFFLS
jgi:carboxylesterase type B